MPEDAPATSGKDEHRAKYSDHSDLDEDRRPVLVLRLSVVDVVCTLGLLTTLFVLVVTTTWPQRLYGFLSDVCTGEECGPVPFGVDYYIFPLAWGGIGAAITAAVIGPFVSLLKGWRMYYWPMLAGGILMVSSLAGHTLTVFCERFWH